MHALVVDIPGTTTIPFTTVLTVDGHALDLEDEAVSIPSPGGVKVYVEPVNEGFLLTGVLEIGVRLLCSRCLAPLVWQVSERFRLVLSRDVAVADADDDWVLFPKGEREFDLAPVIRELIIVALPVKPLCSADCLGLCPSCGNDRNQTPCRCRDTAVDPRWATLASLVQDDESSEREERNHGIAEEEDIQEQA